MSAGLEPGASGNGATQDEPRLATHETSDQERRDGLIAQLRADVRGESPAVVEQAVRRRFEETGVPIDDGRIRDLVAELAADDASD